MKKKTGAYLILTHSYKPIIAGPNAGKVQAYEACKFVENYKPSHLQTATIIMDAHTRTLIKSIRDPDGNRVDYDTIEEHVIRGYADKYRQFLELIGAEIPEALLLSNDEVESKLQHSTNTQETE